MSNPSKENWHVVKRIFKYFKGTPKLRLIYSIKPSCNIARYLDSNFASDVDHRRSLTNYVFTFVGSVIS
jgi:hypothetical protein